MSPTMTYLRRMQKKKVPTAGSKKLHPIQRTDETGLLNAGPWHVTPQTKDSRDTVERTIYTEIKIVRFLLFAHGNTLTFVGVCNGNVPDPVCPSIFQVGSPAVARGCM